MYGGWGDHLWQQGYLAKAIAAGATTVAALDRAVTRTTLQKMKVGAFDPLAAQSEWTGLGIEDLNTTAHQQVAYEAALQSLVLLKNGDATAHAHAAAANGRLPSDWVSSALPLPLPRGKKLAASDSLISLRCGSRQTAGPRGGNCFGVCCLRHHVRPVRARGACGAATEPAFGRRSPIPFGKR